jgi:hypothetical protein
MTIYLLKLKDERLEQVLHTSGKIAMLVLENNPSMRFVEVHAGALLAVECENEPHAIPGCKWEKMEES